MSPKTIFESKVSAPSETKEKKPQKAGYIVEPPLVGQPIPKNFELVEQYALSPPFAYAVIAEEPTRRLPHYFIDELRLNEEEELAYAKIIKTLQIELNAPREEVDPRKYFAEQAQRVADRYKLLKSSKAQVSWAKILYYAERDMVGFGAIDPLMRDPNIEDISVDGIERPTFVYHRKYENLETNLIFETSQRLDDLIVRLAHMSGKHVSTAFPIVDATLPGKHRLAITYRKEVSPRGSTMSIRKFREDPITIIDLINFGTIDYTTAAYAWLLLENRATAIVVGATAAGKTTFLNALLSMVSPNSKIVTIEEVTEINMHHPNWAQLVSRISYGLSEDNTGDISLFSLVKTAMRMRPDILVVGEVRGEEAYSLFQAISTGHGGLCTLHADDTHSAIQRLVSKPMDVAPAYINFLDLVFTVRRVAVPNPDNPDTLRFVRRLISLDEILDSNRYLSVVTWDPQKDKLTHMLEKSEKLKRLAKDQGQDIEELIVEIDNRILVLEWLKRKNIRNYVELSTIFSQYHSDPLSVLARIRAEEMLPSVSPAPTRVMGDLGT